ncbi:MAG: OpgC domain-containing protein [Bryobacterales bacterium]|nr:OpgC domain-containing protein [Bryobacterales bacterium]
MNVSAFVKIPGRDLRVDLARGVALTLVYVDHIHGNYLSDYTLQRFCFFDAAEVFVFLSGLVSGLVYTSCHLSTGFGACASKALNRCSQLYLAQICLFGLSCLVLYPFAARGVYLPSDNLYSFLETPLPSVWAALTLAHAPGLMCLLPLYIVLIAFTPFAIALLCRRAEYLLAASVVIYLVPQFRPEVTLYFNYPSLRPWSFNPFAWQLLFVLGMLIGSRKARGLPALPNVPRWMIGTSLIGLAALLLLRCGDSPAFARLIHTRALRDCLSQLPHPLPFTRKSNLELLRIVHFLLVISVSRFLVSPVLSYALRLKRLASGFIRMGANSLPVYVVAVPISYAASALTLGSRGNRPLMTLVTVAGFALMLATAKLVTFYQASRGAGSPPRGPRVLLAKWKAFPNHVSR